MGKRLEKQSIINYTYNSDLYAIKRVENEYVETIVRIVCTFFGKFEHKNSVVLYMQT
jgi:hypothetical protein